ncbi:MAG: AraC family transcriptional regulator, partial [Bacteroidota bacterium]
HNIFYNPYQKGTTLWAGGACEAFEVNFSRDFLLAYLPDNHQLFEILKNNIEKKRSSSVARNNYPITPEMYSIIRKIIRCSRTGHFRKMFIESSVLELLMLQLEQISNYPNQPVTISKKNQEKILEVRQLLELEYHQLHTLNTLAKRVGTNDFMLKKGFKELFGTTVFGYWNQLKMRHAEELLMQGGLSVAEVSKRVGFTNAQSFCSAFKRNFGYSPSKVRG